MKKILYLITFLVVIGIIQTLVMETMLPEGEYLNLTAGPIAYSEYGQGPPVIMIHGSPGGKEDFKLLAPKLQGYKIYVLDMYGFGESEKHVDNYGIAQQARVVKEFMDSRNIEKATILGYSWGGGVTIEFAHQFPERTEKIILLSGMGIQEGEPTGSYWIEHARYLISYPFVAWYPSSILTLPALSYESGKFITNEDTRIGFMRSFIDSDQRQIRKEMQEIKIPALILHGKNDTDIEPWVAEEHSKLMENSRLVWFDGGHGKIFSDVSQMTPAIQEFLDEA